MDQFVHIYLIGIAIATIVLLALEKVHLSVLGIGLVIAVAAPAPWVPGLLDAKAAIAGFANPAVVTIAALYIVGEGFLRTGAALQLADRILQRTGGNEATVVFLVMIMAALLSAFVNNTLVVVTFMPVITTICQRTGLYPSRLLIPLSYACILGGMCSLVGTSTNLLVSGVLADLGKPELTMFQMSPAGILIACVGILYLGLVGRHFLPRVHSLTSQMTGGATKEYVMELTVGKGSKLVGQVVTDIGKDGVHAVMLIRDENAIWPPFEEQTVSADDILMLTGPVQELSQMQQIAQEKPEGEDQYDPSTMSFFELALPPNSNLVGQTIGGIALKNSHGSAVVAIERSGKHIRERLATMTLHAGDVLLAFGDDRSKASLRQSPDYHLIEGIDEKIYRSSKAPISLAIIAIVVALFVTGQFHYVIAALLGATLMTVTGCLSVRRALQSVNWPILLFIGGTIAFSKALNKCGTSDLIAGVINDVFGSYGPFALLFALYFTTILLTEVLTNNAVAIIMTPIALATAEVASKDLPLGEPVNYLPFVFAVMLGASCCFANPVGYTTNLLVFGPGGYRFSHFLRVGLPMDFILGIVGVTAIALFWPLS